MYCKQQKSEFTLCISAVVPVYQFWHMLHIDITRNTNLQCWGLSGHWKHTKHNNYHSYVSWSCLHPFYLLRCATH